MTTNATTTNSELNYSNADVLAFNEWYDNLLHSQPITEEEFEDIHRSYDNYMLETEQWFIAPVPSWDYLIERWKALAERCKEISTSIGRQEALHSEEVYSRAVNYGLTGS